MRTPIDVKVCAAVDLSSGQVLSHFGSDIFKGVTKCRVEKGARVDHFWRLGYQFVPFDCEYVENGKSDRYMSNCRLELNISSTKKK